MIHEEFLLRRFSPLTNHPRVDHTFLPSCHLDLRVRASPGVHASSPTLEVSWSGTSDRLITFTVCYSTTYGVETTPPPDANCKHSLSRKHVTLDSLSTGTKYHIWVRPLWDLWQGNYGQRLSVYTYEGE